jgi:hypothetical protein
MMKQLPVGLNALAVLSQVSSPRLAMNRKSSAATLGLAILAVILLPNCGSSNFHPPAETIAATSGTSQSAPVYAQFGAPLVATVTMGGAPVSGAFVVFSAPSTGASGTFASTLSNTETDVTNSSGVATSSFFTANGAVGADTVTASVAGTLATTTFNLTNTSAGPATIAVTSGSLQDIQVSGTFGDPLAATVLDTYGNPVSGVSVTFTAPGSGASGTFASNSTITETDTTSTSGVATSSTFTANGTAGAYNVVATVATNAGTATVNFLLTNVTGALISITPTSGTPQSASVNGAFAAPLVATVVDGNQNPISGALVTFEVPAAGAGGTFANGHNTATTNANGVATSAVFTANGSVGTYTVTATVASGAEPANFALTNAPINFAFYLSGLEFGESYYALAGSVTLDGNGNVLGGEQDYNDAGFGFQSPEPSGDVILPGTGALVVDPTTGQGTLTLTTDNTSLGVNGVETLAVQFVNAKHALVAEFDGFATSSGSLDVQTLASSLNDGNYAFSLSGEDPSSSSIVFGGVFSISSNGTALSGTFDVDDAGANSTPTLGTAFTGTITGPDAFGRGTIASADLGITALNYYVVGPEVIRIIDVDGTDSGVGSAFGQGTGTFSNASLGNSVFGVESNSFGSLYAAAGMFFTVPGSGTFNGVADDNEFDNGVIAADAPITGTYTVGSNGYGSLTIPVSTPPQLGDVSVLGIYMTDPSLNLLDPNNTTSGLGGALIVDLDGFTLNGSGVLIPQTDTSTASFAGSYAFGAQVYNDFHPSNFGYEFDFVGQGAVGSSALSGATGLLSDPFFAFEATAPDGTDSAKFSGTATPDPVNAGRYAIPLNIAVAADPVKFNSAIYQASGTQLFWVDVDANGESAFLGSLQQQGSLAGLPAVLKAGVKARVRRKIAGDRQR